MLILSTFPHVRARHGGQIRLKNIVAAYREAGFDVTSLAIYAEESYTSAEYSDLDLAFPATSSYRNFAGRAVPFITDYTSGLFAVAEDGGWPTIARRLTRKYDVIHSEQPWLWELAKKLNYHLCDTQAVLVYGSENLEASLKGAIFKDYGLSHPDVLEEINLLEQKASREADLVAAVTEDELNVLRSWGAKVALLAANGIEDLKVPHEIVELWRSRLPQAPWLLYVASAHPPNFLSLAPIFGGSLGCFPPDSRLVVAGSVGEHAYRVLSEGRWGALNQSRLHLLFQLDDEDLAAVKQLAHGFVLPIGSGGGSNLKTAEALHSGSYVIGTPTAFRGFEQYRNAAGVFVADTPRAFHEGVRETLRRPPCDAFTDSGEALRRSELLWSSRLKAMVDTVISLTERKRS